MSKRLSFLFLLCWIAILSCRENRHPVPDLPADQALQAVNLRCEYLPYPLGLDREHPRFFWQIQGKATQLRQSAYQVQVSSNPDNFEQPHWDTGRQANPSSTQISYTGPKLQSGKRYFWRVRVWTGGEQPSPWSEPAWWEMGLLNSSDWKAQWITAPLPETFERSEPAHLIRHSFDIDKKIASARLYATALGLYEAYLNGKRVSDDYFAPGWTSYHKRLQYQTYDVTDFLQNGGNVLGFRLGDGWYRGYLAWGYRRNTYGKQLGLLAQLVITYEDGSQQIIATQPGWKAASGGILSSDIYNGETFDARLEPGNWMEAGFEDHGWINTQPLSVSVEKLVSAFAPPVRIIDTLPAKRIFQTPEGHWVADFGQNFSGWVQIKVNAPAGTTITVRHAETLDRNGNFYTANLRSAAQTNRYITNGEGEETFRPHFTFQGFRYAALEGWPGIPDSAGILGLVLHSSLTPTGTFECSNPLLNQLQKNIQWSQRGNFFEVPMDCPQRDERMGWTGDAQVFAPTACFNFESVLFFDKWLRDLAADQLPDGNVPFVAPHVLNPDSYGSSGWSDAAVIVPWALYRYYSDRQLLEQQYPSMKAWVDYEAKQAGDNFLWQKGAHYGDWLFFNNSDPNTEVAFTDKDYIATAYFAHSARLLSLAAGVLGKKSDAEYYNQLHQNIVQAFQKEYLTAGGRLSPNTQTAYVLALAFDLLPEEVRPEAARRLSHDIDRRLNHLSTGFLGTPYLCEALSENGLLDKAYNLLQQETPPSWLHPVKMGATTIWERWEGMKVDSVLQPPDMNSLNHYAYGAVGAWMYAHIGGIAPDPVVPGFQRIRFRPRPGGGITWAKTSYRSLYGLIRSEWKIENGEMHWTIEIPGNSTGAITLPHAQLQRVKVNGRTISDIQALIPARQEGDHTFLELGSGSYDFVYAY